MARVVVAAEHGAKNEPTEQRRTDRCQRPLLDVPLDVEVLDALLHRVHSIGDHRLRLVAHVLDAFHHLLAGALDLTLHLLLQVVDLRARVCALLIYLLTELI
jgi:hypothetical protein